VLRGSLVNVDVGRRAIVVGRVLVHWLGRGRRGH
jgi:hypothetical protein